MRKSIFATVAALTIMTAPAVSKTVEDGKYLDDEEVITYNVQEDGTVDWYTYSGFRRYHSECHVCHGPEGLGSTYAPALIDSLKNMDYWEYLEVVMSGREVAQSDGSVSVMPAFGDNVNVSCYADDIYAYLKARSDGKLGRGRPGKREPKPQAARDFENDCLE